MADETKDQEPKAGISKLKLAVGAASLFLFIVGVKRTFRVEDSQGSRTVEDERRRRERERAAS